MNYVVALLRKQTAARVRPGDRSGVNRDARARGY
jgi:hypothetical protein